MSSDPSLWQEIKARAKPATVWSTPLRYHFAVLALIVLALGPYMGWIETISMLKWAAAFYFVMFVISWDFVVGYTGQISFGHTLFFATGGYTTALLNLNFDVDPLIGIVIGTALATLAGLLYAIPALRLEGHYLALFTLLPPLILLRLFTVFRDYTGGTAGLPSPDTILDLGDFTTNALAHYYLALALLVAVFLLTWLITRSNTGQILTAIRESEDAVQSAGFNPAKFKVYSMVLSAGIGGFAAAVFVHTPAGSASPSQLLELTLMLEILLASILGGFGTITGAVVGGLFIYWGVELTRQSEAIIPLLDVPVADIHMLLFFMILLTLVYFLSEGVLPWSYRQGNRLLRSIRGDSRPLQPDGGRDPQDGVAKLSQLLKPAENSQHDQPTDDERRNS